MKALVVAGGVPQIELIKQLKNRGISTVLIDGNANPIAKPYAEKFIQIQIFDIDAVKKIAIDENVDFIITVCADQVLLVVAQVSEILGLPFYIDYRTALDVSDKNRMKRIFKEKGIPTSEFVEFEHLDLERLKHLTYPLVVKPVDAYSSRGVRKAENESELIQFYNEAIGISRKGNVIVEEYCTGTEISVDAFVSNGEVKILCISNSDKILDDGRFVIFRGRYPANVSENIIKEIKDVAQRIVDAFELKNCPLLIQMIENGENVSVLEFCARTGGNMKWLLIKHSCGVDVISAAIDLSLGIVPELEVNRTGNALVVNDFIYCHKGIFDHLEGFDELVNEGVINDYYAIRPRGWQVQGVTSSSDRIVGVNIVAGSVMELNSKQEIINRRARIIDNNGFDIMRHDLIPNLQES